MIKNTLLHLWENKVKEQILIIGSNWLYYVFEMDQSDLNLIFEMDQSDLDHFDPLEKLKKIISANGSKFISWNF